MANEQEIKKAIEEGKVELVTPPQNTDAPIPAPPSELQEFIAVLKAIQMIKRHLTAAPTTTPKNLADQIQFVDTGSAKSLYLWINNAWQQFTNTPARYKRGVFTGETTDITKAYTGVGFKPKMLVFHFRAQVDNGSHGVGTADETGESGGTHAQDILSYFDGTNWKNQKNDNEVITIYNGAATAKSYARIESTDNDGFTLNWDFNVAGVASWVEYEAFG